MQTKSFEEKRVFSRYPIYMQMWYERPSGYKKIRAYTHDLSVNGLCMLSREKFPLHAGLRLSLAVPSHTEEYQTQGRVVWSKKLGWRRYIMGISLEKPQMMCVFNVLSAIKSCVDLPHPPATPEKGLSVILRHLQQSFEQLLSRLHLSKTS